MAISHAAITVIDLTPHEIECHICGHSGLSRFGVPIYEDEIVPDEYRGEWGGVPVCHGCYYLTRGLQFEHPGRHIAIALVRSMKD